YATVGAAGSYNLPAGGNGSDYFLRTSFTESGKTEAERVTLNAASAGLVGVVSAGVGIPVGERWEVYVEPRYRYPFYPVIKQPNYKQVPVEHFMRSISLASGLMFKF